MGDFAMFCVGVLGMLVVLGGITLVNISIEHDNLFHFSQNFCIENGYDYAIDRGLGGGIFCVITHPTGFYGRINVKDLNMLVNNNE